MTRRENLSDGGNAAGCGRRGCIAQERTRQVPRADLPDLDGRRMLGSGNAKQRLGWVFVDRDERGVNASAFQRAPVRSKESASHFLRSGLGPDMAYVRSRAHCPRARGGPACSHELDTDKALDRPSAYRRPYVSTVLPARALPVVPLALCEPGQVA
jgi:hypothetical protein